MSRCPRSSAPLQFRPNCIHHTFKVLQNVLIPEAQDAISSGLELRTASGVVGFLFRVLCPVDLDNQFVSLAAEIGEVSIDGRLAAELCSVHLPIAQDLPEFVFRDGGLSAQRSGAKSSRVLLKSGMSVHNKSYSTLWLIYSHEGCGTPPPEGEDALQPSPAAQHARRVA